MAFLRCQSYCRARPGRCLLDPLCYCEVHKKVAVTFFAVLAANVKKGNKKSRREFIYIIRGAHAA